MSTFWLLSWHKSSLWSKINKWFICNYNWFIFKQNKLKGHPGTQSPSSLWHAPSWLKCQNRPVCFQNTHCSSDNCHSNQSPGNPQLSVPFHTFTDAAGRRWHGARGHQHTGSETARTQEGPFIKRNAIAVDTSWINSRDSSFTSHIQAGRKRYGLLEAEVAKIFTFCTQVKAWILW